MALVSPYHSKLPSDRPVYHNSSLCTEGNNIEPRNRVPGTGNRPRCKNCADREAIANVRATR